MRSNTDACQPSLSISYVVAQLLVFPIGRAWEKLPRWRVPLGRFTFDVNPGPFSIKEHALIVIVGCSDSLLDLLVLTLSFGSASISAPALRTPRDHWWRLSAPFTGTVTMELGSASSTFSQHK